MADSSRQANGFVTGNVTYMIFWGIEDATVTASGTSTSAKTNATGYFNLALSPGNYTLKVAKEGYKDYSEDNVSVTEGNTTDLGYIMMQARTGDIYGKVTDADTGEPIDIAFVTPEGYFLGAMTDDDGQYKITGVKVGTINVTAEDYIHKNQTKTITVKEGTNNLDFALEPHTGGDLWLVIHDGVTGPPIQGAKIFINEVYKDVTTSSGTYIEMGLDAGFYDLRVTCLGFVDYHDEEMEIVTGKTAKMDIYLHKGFNLTVTVKDENGNPVAGANVTFSQCDATTDSAGKATMTCSVTWANLVVEKDGFSKYTESVNLDQDNKEVNVVLKAGGGKGATPSLQNMVLLIVIVVVIVIIVVALVLVRKKRKGAASAQVPPPQPAAMTVPTQPPQQPTGYQPQPQYQAPSPAEQQFKYQYAQPGQPPQDAAQSPAGDGQGGYQYDYQDQPPQQQGQALQDQQKQQ